MTKVLVGLLTQVVAPTVGSLIGGPIGLAIAKAATAAGGALILSGASEALSSVVGGSPSQRADTTESSRKSAIPACTRAYGELRLYGDWILYSFKSDGAPVDVWAFHDGRMSLVLQVYLNDDKVTISGGVVQQLPDKRYRDSKLLAGYNFGASTETAHAAVVSALPGIWTTDHRGDGIVTGYLIKQLTKGDKFLETYPNGDDIQMSLAAQWAPVFDFRDPAQHADDPSTWAYSDNAALALCHYLITQRGYNFVTNILPQINSWTAAADDCDSAVPLAAGGAEPRYRLALAYKATETPSAVINAILNTFDGWYCENERGELTVYSGRYYAPTVSIGSDQIVSYTLQQHVAAEDAVNEVLITYVSAEHDYNTVDAQSWRNQTLIDDSGREPVTAGLEAQIPSATQGRRLAKRKMIRANAPSRGSVVTTFSGRSVLGERFVNLRIEEAGAVFYDGPAEIVGSPERDMQTGGVRFDWIAATPAIDDWDPDEETGDPTVVGEQPEVAELTDPVIDTGEVEAFSYGAEVTLDVSAPDRDDLTWLLRWRINGTTTWTPVAVIDSDPGTPVQIIYGLLPIDQSIDIEVAYSVADGRSSEWSNIETVDTTYTP